MLKRKMDSAIAGLMQTVSFPLLGFSALITALNSELPKAYRPARRRGPIKPRATEFCSARAIEAYEELIDEILMERCS